MSRPKLFKNLTLKEKYSLFLESLNYVEVDSRNRYKIYKSNKADLYFLLGSNGAIRKNYKPIISGSVSVKFNEKFNQFCQSQGE